MRQGDPLSPLLFVLVMEAIGRMLDKAIHEGRLSGFHVSDSAGRSLVISHLLFADDTLIFCDVNIDQLLILHMVLIWFKVVFGLKVNLGKSKLVAVGAVQNFDLLVVVLGYKQGSLPMKYLGLPLGIRNLRTFNVTLLGKWLWRFGQESDALWHQVIEAKYGCDWGGCCSSPSSGPHGVSLWKNIRRGWPSLSWFFLYEVGDGSKVRFWLDR